MSILATTLSLLPIANEHRYLASAPEEFKDFIRQKAEGNKQLVELFAGNVDVRFLRIAQQS
jgi:hypothetical protein